MISVKLTGQFRALAPEDCENGAFELEAGRRTLGDLLSSLGVEDAGIKYAVWVNNARKPKDYTPQEGDSIIVMPLLAGG